MRYAYTLLAILFFGSHADAQLIAVKGKHMTVEVASDVPPELRGDVTLSFRALDTFFDGGSQGADFRINGQSKLLLFFPHVRYWTADAREKQMQPVGVLKRRDGKQVLVEIKPSSKFSSRVADLIDADVSSGSHSAEEVATLKRVAKSVRKRTVLREIADRMDPSTVELKKVDPFD